MGPPSWGGAGGSGETAASTQPQRAAAYRFWRWSEANLRQYLAAGSKVSETGTREAYRRCIT
jgi:hypothetical protein